MFNIITNVKNRTVIENISLDELINQLKNPSIIHKKIVDKARVLGKNSLEYDNIKKYNIKYVYDIKQNICVNSDIIDNINQHIIPDNYLNSICKIKEYFVNTDKNNCVTIKGLCNILETFLNETIEKDFLYKRLFREIERDIKFHPFKVIANIDKDKSNLVTNWIQSSNSFTGEVLQINPFDTNESYNKDNLCSEECFNLFYKILNYYKQWI